MTEPHSFRRRTKGNQCAICGGWKDASYHNLELFSDVDKAREAARQEQEAREMTTQLRQPLKDVSKASGIMERESPLFYGTGNNPTLF